MSKVYRHAFLNISADGSRNARGGCFQPRKPEMTYPLHFSIPTSGDTFWLAPNEPDVFRSITDSPIAARGWVFQERQLSRRILHFTDTQVEWECCANGGSFASEMYPQGASFKTDFVGKAKVQSRGDLSQLNIRSRHESWAALCEQYSNKSFSFISDKLIALSGLAQEFASALQGDVYLAGLWRSTLPHSLLWKAEGSGGQIASDAYVGPSWSWVSVDGPVSEMKSGHNDERQALLNVLDTAVDLVVPSAPTGGITGASMKVCGFLRRVTILPDYEEKPWYLMAIGGMVMHKLRIHGSQSTITAGIPMNGSDPHEPNATDLSDVHISDFNFSFDDGSMLESKPEEIKCFFLPVDLQGSIDPVSGTVSGLLLWQTGDEAVFQRIGVLGASGYYTLSLRYARETPPSDSDEDDPKVWGELKDTLIRGYDRKEGRVRGPALGPATTGESSPACEPESLAAWYATDTAVASLGFERVKAQVLTLI